MRKIFYKYLRGILCVVLANAGLSAELSREKPGDPVSIPIEECHGFWIAHGVYLNGSGPHRLLIDTGSESSTVDEALAAEMRLEPDYRVEIVTATGTALVPAVERAHLRISMGFEDAVDAGHIEILIHNLGTIQKRVPGVRGVLGANLLAALRVKIDMEHRQLIFDPQVHEFRGDPVAVRIEGGRILVPAEIEGMEGRSLQLRLDSGAGGLILFRSLHSGAKACIRKTGTVYLQTHTGSTIVSAGQLRRFRLAGKTFTDVEAAFLPQPAGGGRTEDGLLPLSFFRSVTLDLGNGRVFLEVDRRPNEGGERH